MVTNRLIAGVVSDTVTARMSALTSAGNRSRVRRETASATARFEDGRLELWLASQAPEQARRRVAEALDMTLADVVLYPMPAGGSDHERNTERDPVAARNSAPILKASDSQPHEAGMPRPR